MNGNFVKKTLTAYISICAGVFLLSSQSLANSEQKPVGAMEKLSGNEIMYQSENKPDGDTQITRMSMTLVNAKGQKRVRKIRAFRKDYGANMMDSKTAYFFEYPRDVKDTAYLSHDWDDENVDDDSWLYLPSLKRVKRLADGDKSDGFLGSDFTYTDMNRNQRKFFDYAILEDSDIVDGHDCWVLEGTPKPGKEREVINETGYAKVNIWVRKDNLMRVKGVFWLKKGKKVKYLEATDIEQIDGIWTAKLVEMKTTKHDRVEHTTVLKFDGISYNEKIDDSFFTPQRLKRGI